MSELRNPADDSSDDDWTAKQLDSAVAEAPAFNRARAESISDNEVNQAEREGLNVAMRNSQVAEGKVWQTQEDEAVEEDCRCWFCRLPASRM